MNETIVFKSQVSVKTVDLQKRNLTQRLFKQIEIEKCFDEFTGQLNGTLWGYINYFWGKEKSFKSSEYVHVLWVNKKNDLRRCIYKKEDLKMPLEIDDILNNIEKHIVFEIKKENDYINIIIRPSLQSKVYLDHFYLDIQNILFKGSLTNNMIVRWNVFEGNNKFATVTSRKRDLDFKNIESLNQFSYYYKKEDFIKYIISHYPMVYNEIPIIMQQFKKLFNDLYNKYVYQYNCSENIFITRDLILNKLPQIFISV